MSPVPRAKHTVPSEAFVTKPVSPMLRACFWVKERKLTPCTWPSTLNEMRELDMVVVVAVFVTAAVVEKSRRMCCAVLYNVCTVCD